MASLIQRYPQLAKAALVTSRLRANPENRVWAKVIDTSLVLAVVFALEYLAPILIFFVPTILFSMMDKMGRGQSPGKWLLGLHTIDVSRGEIASFYGSFLRNLPFIGVTMSIGLLGVWSWLPLLPLFAWIALECYFIFHIRSGIRVGDVLGGTRVADYKDEHTRFIEQFLKEEEVI